MQRRLTCLLQRLPVDHMLFPRPGATDVSRRPSLFAVWCIHNLIDYIDCHDIQTRIKDSQYYSLHFLVELHFLQKKNSKKIFIVSLKVLWFLQPCHETREHPVADPIVNSCCDWHLLKLQCVSNPVKTLSCQIFNKMIRFENTILRSAHLGRSSNCISLREFRM